MEETRRPFLLPSFRSLPTRHRSKLLQHMQGYGRRGTGFFNSGNPKKQIRDLQKVIDLLNKSIEDHAKDEKYYLDMAADTSRELEALGKSVLESTKMSKDRARLGIRYHAGWMMVLRYEVEYVQRLLKKQIEALQDAEFFTAQKTRRRLSCFCSFNFSISFFI
ncbi:PREDICTED: uncharacterized protein LOC104749398 isoform X2 [Camelina sativa]|uniref:Uncharacterized protein LOC104749398 isoform X2 n=1 Tax=Camelina sativa TaxID=90675 RepID=A0ABM1R3F0_CAMSA|nr:PREDICTED: uncharacterized protein LOC104749398 isoform X2 [Camelina sativa]